MPLTSTDWLVIIGYLLANLGQLNQAATQFEQALEQKPGDRER